MRIVNWWKSRRPQDDEIARELRDHLDLEAERLANRENLTDAASAARRRFGNVSNVQETVHDVWHWVWAEQLGQDVRHAWRALIRNPVYTSTAIITLALGIGATTAVFSIGDQMINRPFPLFPQDELLWIVQRSPQCPSCDVASPAAFMALRDKATSLSGVAAASTLRTALRRTEGSTVVEGYFVSANTFSMIGAPFALGRGFAADADQPGHEGVTVLSYMYWQEAFGGRRRVLDSTITLNGKPHRIVGVLARDVVFPTQADLYAPLVMTAANRNDHGSRYLGIFARLAPGKTRAEAIIEARVISQQLTRESPKTDAGWTLGARPLKEFHTDDVRTLIAILGSAVALVLIAACVSVANLALARTTARRRELALRAALGGRRGRLARHLLAESMLVALAGGAVGVGLSVWGVRMMHDSMPASMTKFVPGWAAAHVDLRALAFALAVSIATTLVFALLPTVRATQVPLSSVLSDGGRSSAGGVHGTRWRSLLVIAEVSVALILLTGATLLSTSVRNMLRGDPGVRREDVVTMHLTLAPANSDSAAREFVRRLDERFRATPGVRAAGLASTTPLSNNFWGTAFTIPGRTPPKPGEGLSAIDQRVTPDYFRTMGIRVLNGREIIASDDAGAQRVIVINRYMAEQLWPGRDPVGRSVTIDSQPWTIVGIASDVRHGGFDEPMRYEIDRSLMQAVTRVVELEVWTVGDPMRMAGAVRRTVAAVDPAAAVGGVMTMHDMEARHVSPFRMMAGMLGVFAAVTMLIAVVGLYGVIAYGVAQRTRELGVRIALGARGRDVLSNVAGGAVRLAAIGTIIGGAGAFAFAQLLRSLLYRVTANDPTTPLAMAALLLAVAVIAAIVPAWRASRIDPSVALRE